MVGALAADSSGKFSAAEFGRVAGALHDIGKYSRQFQSLLSGQRLRVDHSTAGAKLAVEQYRELGPLIAFTIAGHHAGLANGLGEGSRSVLDDRLKARWGIDIPALADDWRSEIELPPSPGFPALKPHPDRNRRGFSFSLFIRMLFSCLVDADRRDTEAFYAKVEGIEVQRGQWPPLRRLKDTLEGHLVELQAHAPGTPVNQLRAEILAAAREAAVLDPGLFSLTVPTGGGKTLTGLAFALDHAVRFDLDRVIYVAPFTSVIEQNADVFRRALQPHADVVLEHHSAFRDEAVLKDMQGRRGEQGPEAREKLKLAMETWDAPVVTTTAVQFFESLFSARPSQCRKLHNIARSVVILDEAQTIPLPLLRPCVAAIDELARNYGASIVLCTATQPALEEHDDPDRSFRGGLRDVREIAPEPRRLYEALKRVRVRRWAGPLGDSQLAEELARREQVLCIVNSRAHARALFESIKNREGARHLSTLMCAAHRARVLDDIRNALRQDRPCRVVSTSLIECGVDVSFPCVYRAETGLDAIAQAAGRCNREGRFRVTDSHVIVFESVGWPMPPELRAFAQVVREVMRTGDGQDDPLSLAAVTGYFRRLYWSKEVGRDSDLDKHDIMGQLNVHRPAEIPFEDVAHCFRMIESDMQPVLIPYDDDARDLLEALRFAERVGGIARKLQRYVVPVPRRAFARLRAAGAVVPARDDAFGEQFCTLANESLYRRGDVGLTWDDPTFVEAETLIV